MIFIFRAVLGQKINCLSYGQFQIGAGC